MTVTNTTNFKEYLADGIATVFTIPFKLLDRADLQVYLKGNLLTTGFTVRGIGNPTSEIVFAVPPEGRLLLQRYVEPLRYTDYQDNGDLLAATLNQDFDRLYMLIQGQGQSGTQSLRVPEPEGIDTLPVIADRANKLLAFDGNGEPLMTTVEAGSAVDLAMNLANNSDAAKGAALIGFSDTLPYGKKTLGEAVRRLSYNLEVLDVGPPIFSVLWWPLRTSIPAGYLAADGQELAQADYQEAYNGIIAGLVPTCTETDWQNTYSAPNNTNKRGCYVAESSTGKFRLPDYNGIHAGIIQATGAFLRGGVNDNEAGIGRLNQMASHVHESMQVPKANLAFETYDILTNKHDEQATYIGANTGRFTITKPNSTVDSIRMSTSKPTIPSEIASSGAPFQDYAISEDKPTENYPNHYSGVWIIKLTGTHPSVSSPTLDEIDSALSKLQSITSDLSNWKDEQRFAIIYPDGGTETSLKNAAVNTRYIENNPFAGDAVICQAEVLVNGVWGTTGWQSGTSSYGVVASHITPEDKIVIQTGVSLLIGPSRFAGNGFGLQVATGLTSLPFRVKVWRVY